MQEDIRETDLYREAEALYRRLRRPGAGLISDAAEVHVSPDGEAAVFVGTCVSKLEGAPATRICRIDLTSSEVRVLTFGPHTDRSPKFSPDGRCLAFLSDRHEAGDFQLHLLDPVSAAVSPAAFVEGRVEYLQWSPDGRRILLGVAERRADLAGAHGALGAKQYDKDRPSWIPEVQDKDQSRRWRRVWVYELGNATVRQIGEAADNVWEAAWCGNEAIAIVASSGPEEGLWYSARLRLVDLATERSRELYAPKCQLGGLAASPSGEHLAIVEALCSDRWFVAGSLVLIATRTGETRQANIRDVDVSHVEWRSDRGLLVAGHRGFETVVAVHDAEDDVFTELWSSPDITTTGRYATVSGLGVAGDCVLVGESFVRAPEIAVIRNGRYRSLRSFDSGYGDEAHVIGAVERLTWRAPDGLEIQGWLLRPRSGSPHPLVMEIHGGPVWHWRPRCLGRAGLHVLMLLKRGYAIFFPNPRGSTGRGPEFSRHVLGEMGGADTYDLLSGLDQLVERGIADPARLGIIGRSYGGFMAAWLITQDARFAAAVAVAPITNHVTQHLTSNIPHFVSLFLADTYTNLEGKYFQRSPIMHARKVRTPTLSICGALDRCTPPQEAVQFHTALLENGVNSVLVVYPEEGHGIQKLPAAIDYGARVVGWFHEHMSAAIATARPEYESPAV